MLFRSLNQAEMASGPSMEAKKDRNMTLICSKYEKNKKVIRLLYALPRESDPENRAGGMVLGPLWRPSCYVGGDWAACDGESGGQYEDYKKIISRLYHKFWGNIKIICK